MYILHFYTSTMGYGIWPYTCTAVVHYYIYYITHNNIIIYICVLVYVMCIDFFIIFLIFFIIMYDLLYFKYFIFLIYTCMIQCML